MVEPTDNEIVFALTRATSREMFARGYRQGRADAERPPRPFLPLMIGVFVGVAIAALAWWAAGVP